MSKKMLAAVVEALGQPLVLKEAPVPVPHAGQVLIRIEASGICLTDVHVANGDWPLKPRVPFIPGHEGAGYVVATGSGVSSLKEGDRVGVPWLYSACGRCPYCLAGRETLCPHQQNTGYSVHGTCAEYLVAQADYVAVLPKTLGMVEAAPMLCAGVTTYTGLKETDTQPGDWVVISGIGGLGHIAIQYALAMGMHVAAVDTQEEKLALARDLGAELTVNATSCDPAEFVQESIGGAHGALITAESQGAFTQGLGMLRRHGTCVLVGLPAGEFPTPIFDVVLKRLTIRGSIIGTRLDMIEALQFAALGKIQPALELQPFNAINDVIDRLKKGDVTGRVVLRLH
jgi:propanol-preferring alcohol dehydrogenase